MIGSIGFVELVALIWAILCIILFFKIWGACNDIGTIVKKFVPKSVTPETKDEVETWLKGNNDK